MIQTLNKGGRLATGVPNDLHSIGGSALKQNQGQNASKRVKPNPTQATNATTNLKQTGGEASQKGALATAQKAKQAGKPVIGGQGSGFVASTLTKKHLDELNRAHAYNQGSMMSLQMNKNFDLLSEDGKQVTHCLMNLATKAMEVAFS